MDTTSATASVLTVGGGRGFVIEGPRDRIIITAAHCLPFIPPAIAAMNWDEKTYRELLAPLGQVTSIAAECLFVDPVMDIAVLGAPDGEELYEECTIFDALIETMQPLAIAEAPKEGKAWLLSLAGDWGRCDVGHVGGPLWITNAAGAGIRAGMSGSPIVNDNGAAIGVVCSGVESNATEGWMNPNLMMHLPGWIVGR